MELLSTRKAGAAKAAGEVAQRALQSAVRDAVREALKETDYVEVEESSDTGRSVLLFAAGVAAGYLLARQSPSWLDSAEESGGIERITETIAGGEGSDSSGGSGSGAGSEGEYGAAETRVGSDPSDGPDIGSNPEEERPDIGSTTDQGTAGVGSDTDEATQVDSDADEYGTEDTNVGPGGEDYGGGDDADSFDPDEGEYDDTTGLDEDEDTDDTDR